MVGPPQAKKITFPASKDLPYLFLKDGRLAAGEIFPPSKDLP